MALVWFYTANNHGTSTKPLFQISHVYSDAKQDCFIHILWKFRHWYTMISGFETSWCSAINHLCVATCSVRAMCTMHSATALIWFGDLLDRGYCTSLPHQNGVSLGKNLYCMNNDLSDVTFFILWDCNLRRKPQAGSFELLDRGMTLISELYHICPGPTTLSRTATSASSLTVLFTFSFSASNSATSAATLKHLWNGK